MIGFSLVHGRTTVGGAVIGRHIRAVRDGVLARLDTPAPCALGWIPSVFTPVFYGYRDHDLSLAAPVVAELSATDALPLGSLPIAGSIDATCRVFYPSLDGSPHDAPPRTGCSTTPLIVFAHGQCDPGNVPSDFYLAWYELRATLARAGYVVVVPRFEASGARSDDDLERLVRPVDWARSSSPYKEMLKPSPSTGLVAHSYGAGLAARAVTESRIAARALALLSPQEAVLPHASMPLLRTWGDGFDVMTAADLFSWTPAAAAHAVQFVGAEHHDYIPVGRAECAQYQQNGVTLMPLLAADIVTLFMGRYLPQDRPGRGGCSLPLPRPHVPISLEPANWARTTEQQFYAGGWHAAWPLLDTGDYQPVRLHHWSGGSWHTTTRG